MFRNSGRGGVLLGDEEKKEYHPEILRAFGSEGKGSFQGVVRNHIPCGEKKKGPVSCFENQLCPYPLKVERETKRSSIHRESTKGERKNVRILVESFGEPPNI